MKFWPTNSFLADSTTTSPAATSILIVSAHLFHEDSVVVTSDFSGVVKTWDLVTGICKSSFSTPAEGNNQDTYLVGSTLIIVCWTNIEQELNVWNVYKGQPLRTLPLPEVMHINISGDGPTVFRQGDSCTEAVSRETGENAGCMGVRILHTLDGFLIHKYLLVEPGSQWSGGLWDSQDMKVYYPAEFQGRFRLDVVPQAGTGAPRWIGDTVTKRMVFYFPQRYLDELTKIEWDGRYLLVQSPSRETMVLDFDPVCAR